MSFYRIYRPQIISELDNEMVRTTITGLLKKDREKLPHAFFLHGPKGSGKTTTARIIAKLFNCEKLTKSGPCGKCGQCTSIAAGNNLDVVEIDAASNRGIDDIRLLRERIGLAPAHGGYTVYIIDEVHMLTTEAFNALLKTLEEPPTHAIFILATTDPQKIPATVRSRCVDINFSKASKEDLVAALGRIAKKEKITIDTGALEEIAAVSDGAFRDAVKLLEQASFLEGKVTKENILSVLSKSTESKRKDFLAFVFGGDSEKAVTTLENLQKEGADMKTFLVDCISDLHTELLLSAKGVQTRWNPGAIHNLLRRFTGAYGELRTCPITQLPIELAVVEFIEEHLPTRSAEVVAERVVTEEFVEEEKKEKVVAVAAKELPESADLLNLEKLTSHWPDFIEALKPHNHSVAGVIRSSRPKSVEGGVVTLEAFYPFHKDRLSDPKVRDILTTVLKKLFGANVRVEIVLGNK